MQSSRDGSCLRFFVFGLFLLIACSSLVAQRDETSKNLALIAVSENLQPTKSLFVEIDQCRVRLTQSSLKERLTRAEESLVEGLLIGWDPTWKKRWPQPHYVPLSEARWTRVAAEERLDAPPEMYVRSLQNDATVCMEIVSGKSQDITGDLELLVKDLEIKFRDCYLYGMGRLIAVEVATNKGPIPDAGWTVYFKWLPVSNIPTTEVPFPTSSTPATGSLPPGVYRIRAEKRLPGSSQPLQSEQKIIDFSGQHNKCELQVP